MTMSGTGMLFGAKPLSTGISQIRISVKEVGILLAASIFLAICAQISVPLFFTPVPISLQTFGVLLIGATLGKKRGALAVLLYLCEGLVGLPVFAGLHSGALYFFGPTGGYLLGFVAAAYVVGYCMERAVGAGFIKLLSSLAIGNVVIYLCGLPWLTVWVGSSQVLNLGLYPFIVGDLVKLFVLTAYLYSQKSK